MLLLTFIFQLLPSKNLIVDCYFLIRLPQRLNRPDDTDFEVVLEIDPEIDLEVDHFRLWQAKEVRHLLVINSDYLEMKTMNFGIKVYIDYCN